MIMAMMVALIFNPDRATAYETIQEEPLMAYTAEMNEEYCSGCDLFHNPAQNLYSLIRLKDNLNLTKDQITQLEKLAKMIDGTLLEFEENALLSEAPQPLSKWLEREILLQERSLRLSRKVLHQLETFTQSLSKETRNKIDKDLSQNNFPVYIGFRSP
ncbi:hypothetical protein [Endozoicomonas arenosclerae]|uniref:hypothetical protein n=1 Tax=Endozoicomonas arenosclerae TaxID=1633495 RepID=UPI000783E3A5|nr:hypothetical protein [Endozoicomonas arenosclerae]